MDDEVNEPKNETFSLDKKYEKEVNEVKEVKEVKENEKSKEGSSK